MVLGHKWCARFALAAALTGSGVTAHALEYNRLSLSNEAINGFDPVAYWRTGQPMQGTRAYSYEWSDAVWLFASEADMERFKASPEKYAPAFGGYCAYAMSKGIKAETHPFFFKIDAGRLYFFYSAESRDKFVSDPNAIAQAENQWSQFSTESF